MAAFVAGRHAVLGANLPFALPVITDVSGNGTPMTMYSHVRVPGGTTYTFDVGGAYIVPASTDSVFAIPPGATTITATGASTAQFGQVV